MKIMRRCVSIFLIFCSIVIILSPIAKILERKASNVKYIDFFNDTNKEYDAIFLGTSRAMDAYLPYEIYTNYGIKSYNFGNQGCFIPIEYWVLENVLDYCKPEVVVIDAYGIASDDVIGTVEYTHEALDCFPLSITKLMAIGDLFVGDSEFNSRALEFVWKFVLYHNRWNEITRQDFYFDSGHAEAGAIALFKVMDYEVEENIEAVIPSEQSVELDTIGKEYLCRMIECCLEEDIEVVLTYLPCTTYVEEMGFANEVSNIASLYGVEYINFLDLDVIDYKTDMADSSHVNYSGSLKISEYMGEYLSKYFENKDYMRDVSDYENGVTRYMEYRKGIMRDVTDLYASLMTMRDDDFTYHVYLPKESKVFGDKKAMKLLYNAFEEIEENALLDMEEGIWLVWDSNKRSLQLLSQLNSLNITKEIDNMANSDIIISISDKEEKLIAIKSYCYVSEGVWSEDCKKYY